MQTAIAELIRMVGAGASPELIAGKVVTDLRFWGYVIARSKHPARRPVERFMRFVSPEPNTGCWLWFGATVNGYGQFSLATSETALAHRWSYETFVGPVPGWHTLDHVCSQPACVNPEHLEPVSRAENSRRMHARRSLSRAYEIQCATAYKNEHAPGRRLSTGGVLK